MAWCYPWLCWSIASYASAMSTLQSQQSVCQWAPAWLPVQQLESHALLILWCRPAASKLLLAEGQIGAGWGGFQQQRCPPVPECQSYTNPPPTVSSELHQQKRWCRSEELHWRPFSNQINEFLIYLFSQLALSQMDAVDAIPVALHCACWPGIGLDHQLHKCLNQASISELLHQDN